MAENFEYILRFTIQPGYHEEERLEALLKFCKDSRIDDVMLFADCEELNSGHIDPEGLKPWLDMIARVKPRLTEIGVATSVNPWTTLLHADRGRHLKPGQNFTPMVDREGNEASAQACPLCPEWRKYIAQIYGLYASTKPTTVWVEDDFRFHNHAPLVWGGCFCERHMEEYSRRAGRTLTRREFVDGLLQPGEPHPYRKIWLDCCRETMVQNAAIIGRAVHAVSPETRVGLMSSIPAVHCAEGRDWHGIINNLARGGTPVNRPALMSYTEVSPHQYLWDFSAVAQLTRAMVSQDTLIFPELDNGPFSRFTKSQAMTRLEIEACAALCADGVTLSLFDMLGSGVIEGERWQDMLAQIKPFLNDVKALGLTYGSRAGVVVLASPDSSYTLHMREGKDMRELYPNETYWASVLSSFGVAWRYCLDPVGLRGQTVAVSGQYFRNLFGEQIETLFAENRVVMDGEAAHTLWDMGLGGLAGMEICRWLAADSGVQCYEEVCDGRVLCGVAGARVSAQGTAGDHLAVRYRAGVRPLTAMKNWDGRDVGPGVAVIDNKHLVYPYGRFAGQAHSHLHPFRRELLVGALNEIGKGTELIRVEGAAHLFLSAFEMADGGLALLLTNFSFDRTGPIAVAVSEKHSHILKLIRSGQGGQSSLEGGLLQLPDGLEAMETVAAVLKP